MVQQAQKFIESNIEEKISVEVMSSQFAVSRRNFDRRVIKATGNTPVEYMQRVKLNPRIYIPSSTSSLFQSKIFHLPMVCHPSGFRMK